MRVALVDLPATHGVVSKDTVVGGYGSRLEPFSRVTRVIAMMKRRMHDTPSVHLAYLAAILAKEGHEVVWSRGRHDDADVAIVLSSLVDHKHETAWADDARARGIRVGFVGLTASKLPELFRDHADFIVLKKQPFIITRDQLLTRHPISPYPGMTSAYTIAATYLRGRKVTPETRGKFLSPLKP